MRKRSPAKMRWKQVRLYPPARRAYRSVLELPRIDDRWMIRDATTRELEIVNIRTHHFFRFSTASVRGHEPDTKTDGILRLKIQVVLTERDLFVYPIASSH
jgi:hypothetical protein